MGYLVPMARANHHDSNAVGITYSYLRQHFLFWKDFALHRSEILEKVTFASTYVKLPGRLSVSENLDIFARLNGVPSVVRKERIAHFLKTFDMWNMRDKETGTLSAGQMTRVMLAKAFIPQPAIVLLDEPTASLDPDIAQEVRQFVLKQKREHGFISPVYLTQYG